MTRLRREAQGPSEVRGRASPTSLQDDCGHSPLAGPVLRARVHQAVKAGADHGRAALLVGQEVLCG